MYSTFDLNGGFPWPWVHIWKRECVKMLSCFEDTWVLKTEQQGIVHWDLQWVLL